MIIHVSVRGAVSSGTVAAGWQHPDRGGANAPGAASPGSLWATRSKERLRCGSKWDQSLAFPVAIIGGSSFAAGPSCPALERRCAAEAVY